MRRALSYSVALASILLLVAVTCAPVSAAEYKLGLTLGTTATYSASTTNTNQTSLAMTVTWTNATALTVTSIDHYANGTEKTRYDTWDVRYGPTGNITLVIISLWVVAANLTAGDQIRLYGSTATLNSSTVMMAAGALRSVNLWQLGQDLFAYWDRPTGLLAKLNMNWGPIIGWFNFTLTATSAWTGFGIPGYPFEAIGIALILGILVGVLQHRKRRRHISIA